MLKKGIFNNKKKKFLIFGIIIGIVLICVIVFAIKFVGENGSNSYNTDNNNNIQNGTYETDGLNNNSKTDIDNKLIESSGNKSASNDTNVLTNDNNAGSNKVIDNNNENNNNDNNNNNISSSKNDNSNSTNNSSTTNKNVISATKKYYCTGDYSLSGTKCTYDFVMDPLITYSCSAGTQSGNECIVTSKKTHAVVMVCAGTNANQTINAINEYCAMYNLPKNRPSCKTGYTYNSRDNICESITEQRVAATQNATCSADYKLKNGKCVKTVSVDALYNYECPEGYLQIGDMCEK